MRSAWQILAEGSIVMSASQLKDDIDDFKGSLIQGDEPERRQMFAVIIGDIVQLAKDANLADAASALEEVERKLFKLQPKKGAATQLGAPKMAPGGK